MQLTDQQRTAQAPTIGGAPTFTDPVLTAGGSQVRDVYITELRTRINAVRATHGLLPFLCTTPAILAGTTIAGAVDVIELRTAQSQAYVAAAIPLPGFSTNPAVGGPIRVADITDLRAAVIAIE